MVLRKPKYALNVFRRKADSLYSKDPFFETRTPNEICILVWFNLFLNSTFSEGTVCVPDFDFVNGALPPSLVSL